FARERACRGQGRHMRSGRAASAMQGRRARPLSAHLRARRHAVEMLVPQRMQEPATWRLSFRVSSGAVTLSAWYLPGARTGKAGTLHQSETARVEDLKSAARARDPVRSQLGLVGDEFAFPTGSYEQNTDLRGQRRRDGVT